MEATTSKLSLLTDPVQTRPRLRSSSPLPVRTPSIMGLSANGMGLTLASSETPQSSSTDAGLSPSTGLSGLHPVDIVSPTESVKPASVCNLSADTAPGGQPSAGDTHCQCGAHSETQTYHFRRLLLLHLQVIERQQALLQVKDAEIETLQAEKEMLEVRLQRMERRVAMVGRRNLSTGSSSAINLGRSSTGEATSLSLTAEKRPATDIARRSRTNSPPPKRRSERHGCFGIHTNRIPSSASTSRASTPTLGTLAVPSSTLAIPSSTACVRRQTNNRPLFMTTTHEYDVPAPFWLDDGMVTSPQNNSIEVPSWREIDPMKAATTLRSLDRDVESLDDEVYLRRHFKCEADEKRIKRWDLQRTRSLRQHENLLRRYEEKEQKWRQGDNSEARQQPELLTSFMPRVDELVSVEITSELPVVAFGRLIPNLPQTDFSLPWFDVDAREAEEEMRTTRSRSRSRMYVD